MEHSGLVSRRGSRARASPPTRRMGIGRRRRTEYKRYIRRRLAAYRRRAISACARGIDRRHHAIYAFALEWWASRRMSLRTITALASLCAAALVTFTPTFAQQDASFPFQNPSLPVAQRVDDLVGRMTLEE